MRDSRFRYSVIALAALASCALAAACASAGPSTAATVSPAASDTVVVPEISADRNVPRVGVTVTQGNASASLTVSVAANEAERERGLMWITTMPADEGMIFLFPSDGTGGFWMKNTYIPLDIAYISSAGKLLGIADGQPLSTRILIPPGPYRYVIETNAGWWQSHGFSPGATVHLPANLPPAS